MFIEHHNVRNGSLMWNTPKTLFFSATWSHTSASAMIWASFGHRHIPLPWIRTATNPEWHKGRSVADWLESTSRPIRSMSVPFKCEEHLPIAMTLVLRTSPERSAHPRRPAPSSLAAAEAQGDTCGPVSAGSKQIIDTNAAMRCVRGKQRRVHGVSACLKP